MKICQTIMATLLASVLGSASAPAQVFEAPMKPGPFHVIGLFIASIEEGARIFTPVRLLPFEHPEALGHDFPTVQQLHGGEDRLPVALGRHAGPPKGAWMLVYERP